MSLSFIHNPYLVPHLCYPQFYDLPSCKQKMCLHPLDVWSGTLPGHKGATTSVRSRRPVEQCRLGWLGTMDMIHMSSKVHIYIRINKYIHIHMHLYHSTWSIYYIFSCEDVLLPVFLAKKNICEEDEPPIWMWHSAKESSCIFHWSLVDSCLIGINTLNVGAPGEGHCSVLIVTFAITQDGVPGVSIPEEAPCFFIRCDESTHINVTKTPLLPQACFLSATMRTQEFQSCTWALFVLEHLQDSWHRWDLIVLYPSILTYFRLPKGFSPLKDFPCKIQAPYHKTPCSNGVLWFVIFLSFD